MPTSRVCRVSFRCSPPEQGNGSRVVERVRELGWQEASQTGFHTEILGSARLASVLGALVESARGGPER